MDLESRGKALISLAVTAKLNCAFVFALCRLLVFPCGGSNAIVIINYKFTINGKELTSVLIILEPMVALYTRWLLEEAKLWASLVYVKYGQ